MWLLLLIASVALALVQWGPTPVDSYPIWRREDSRRGPSCPASYDKGELYKHPAWSFGVNMKLVEVANAGECCAKCNADPACVVWLFQDKNLDEFESADDSTIKEILDNAAFTSVPGDDGNADCQAKAR
ncbi:hypothetical protein CAOG_04221 [Capsaspora owczarzaki ATCC 30864]|uniref:hypothetical protein n=1 Tax=Capsaspora owczarzaki (strain ATCC 30864) TaxID=595528 RepID=UPI0001FE455A|nr:hypothetical protein CAOG_04221 [Capsaspora owczarzaki ATCC 30864]|eukprot:XP_004348046.1 hypothetical protein CAOG_04221 [Capsaspora owczarzaki ATCC 30864]